MPRIIGVEIPPEKRVDIALRYIYGIGPVNAVAVLKAAKVEPHVRAKDLTEQQISQIVHAIQDGGYVIEWKADAKPGDPRERQGARIERVAGETRIEPVGAMRCRVVYTYLGDLGGSFPKSEEEKAWKEQPVEYIRALRKALGPGARPVY